MRFLSTVYVRNHRARVQHRRGSLLVSTPEGSQRIPLEGIDAVVVLGGAQITTQALDACVRRGVRVAALHMSGAVRFVVNGATNGNVHLRTALFQAATDEVRSLDLAKTIVAAKLQNSRKVVERWSRDETNEGERKRLAVRGEQIRLRIGRLAGADTADHVRGIEGDAARIYFRAIGQAVASSGLEFSARNAATTPRSRQRHARILLRPAGVGVHRCRRECRPRFPDGVLSSPARRPAVSRPRPC